MYSQRAVFPISIGFLALLIFGCDTSPDPPETESPVASAFEADLIVGPAEVRLWAEAGLDSEVLAWLSPGDRLEELPAVSNFTSRLKIGGKLYDEPFVKVRTEEGREGWIYPRNEAFQLPNGRDMAPWLYDKRLRAYLGPDLQEALDGYRQAFRQIRTQTDFVETYRRGMELRETIVQVLEEKTADRASGTPPDLFWLKEVMPGFLPQLVAEGTAYYLFADYRRWLERARQTERTADDDFVDLGFYLFPQDSVEYFFPVYKIQTWDYGGHSLLGRGHHLGALERIERLSRQTEAFQRPLDQWRHQLLNDITNTDVTYWEEQAAVLAELDRILAADFSCLTREDQIALEIRRDQMENAKKYGIEFNHQSGLY